MATVFPPEVVDAVLHHMNDDHRDDNSLIVRAFAGRDEVEGATMTHLDAHGGTWRYAHAGEEAELHVPWSTTISERPEIRREIVALYDAACEKLGVEARPH